MIAGLVVVLEGPWYRSLPLVELSDLAMVLLSAVAWAATSVAVGYTCHRLPARAFDHDTGLTRLRPWEAGGRVYERRLRIVRWKDRMPEAGAAFAGGFSKKHTPGRGPGALERFVTETRRAETTHWAILACWPLFFLWCRWNVALVMGVYALAANVPCILIQRYNRARLLRILRSRSAGAGPG